MTAEDSVHLMVELMDILTVGLKAVMSVVLVHLKVDMMAVPKGSVLVLS